MVAPPPAVPVDPGERFDQVLAQHSGPTLTKLPQRFEPIARAILPDASKVRLSMGQASRKALAAVGKKAATAGDVVHLAQPLDQSRRSIEILAHELTHVANPSPLVRFLDDDRDSDEERQARAMEALMRQAPVGSPPASPPPAPPPSPAGSSNGSSQGPAGSLLPAGFGGGGSQGSNGAPAPAGAPGAYDESGTQSPPGAREPDFDAEATAAPQIDIDRLLDALEARVIRELERRGRRWPRPL